MILVIFGMMIGCKTQTRTVERNLSVNDTIIHHRAETVSLPTRNITVIDRPCKQDTIRVFQQVQVGNSTVTVSSNDNNELVIDMKTDSLTNIIDNLREKSVKFESVNESETIIIKKTPRWNWYIMGILALLLVLTNLSFIIKVVTGIRIPKLP